VIDFSLTEGQRLVRQSVRELVFASVNRAKKHRGVTARCEPLPAQGFERWPALGRHG